VPDVAEILGIHVVACFRRRREHRGMNAFWAEGSTRSSAKMRDCVRRCPASHWLPDLDVTTVFLEPSSPWENGYIEPCNGKLRDELPNGEVFSARREAQLLVAQW
jgi:hypothetical protein